MFEVWPGSGLEKRLLSIRQEMLCHLPNCQLQHHDNGIQQINLEISA